MNGNRCFFRCKELFDTADGVVHREAIIVVRDGIVEYSGPAITAPRPGSDDSVTDLGPYFVLPGLSDLHVHLSYGNARSDEEIDLYTPAEYRALRAARGAQDVLSAGFTAMADPGSTGSCSVAVRDAMEAGLFTGPRITTAGRQITARNGFADYYPETIDATNTMVGCVVNTVDEAFAEIRLQTKRGVDFIKLNLDTITANPQTGSLNCCFSERELAPIVAECHRLGRRVAAHAHGREATLFASRAGVDLLYHVYEIDDEVIDTICENGTWVCPALTFHLNALNFTRPEDPGTAAPPCLTRGQLRDACQGLVRLRARGAHFLSGSDSGFAVTPYGEWHARELEAMVTLLGFQPAEALICATRHNAGFLRGGNQLGSLQAGSHADFIVVRANPLQDIASLQQPDNLVAVFRGGQRVPCQPGVRPHRHSWESAFSYWGKEYTRQDVPISRLPLPLCEAGPGTCAAPER